MQLYFCCCFIDRWTNLRTISIFLFSWQRSQRERHTVQMEYRLIKNSETCTVGHWSNTQILSFANSSILFKSLECNKSAFGAIFLVIVNNGTWTISVLLVTLSLYVHEIVEEFLLGYFCKMISVHKVSGKGLNTDTTWEQKKWTWKGKEDVISGGRELLGLQIPVPTNVGLCENLTPFSKRREGQVMSCWFSLQEISSIPFF